MVVSVTNEYTYNVERDLKDGGWVGSCVQVPGAVSQGESYMECLRNTQQAVQEIQGKAPTFVSRHLTKSLAKTAAGKRIAETQIKKGKSSGWSRFDYTVRRTGKLIFRWGVVLRSV